MKQLILRSFVIILAILCTSCAQNEKSENKILKEIAVVDSILNSQYYPSKVSIINDTILNIEMELPELEFFSNSKMKIIREMSICSTVKYLDGINGVLFTQYNSKKIGNPKYFRKKYLPKQSLLWLSQLEINNKTLFDFKKYIVQHIRTDKLYLFAGIVKGLYLMSGDGKTLPANYEDYFGMVEQYSLECQGKLKNNYYRELLYRIKFFASEPELKLFPNFDTRDVDYFLHYNNEYYKKNNLLLKDTTFYK